MKKINNGDTSVLLACAIAWILILSACNPTKKLNRKCDKAAQRVEKAVIACPQLKHVDTIEVQVEVPVIERDTFLEIWSTDCDDCFFDVTTAKSDTVVVVRVVKDTSGFRIKTKVTPPLVTASTECETIKSANATLAKGLSHCNEKRNEEAAKVAACDALIKQERKGKAWLWLLVVALSIGHLLRFRAVRRLVKIPF